METLNEYWSIKKIASFLDMSENYTRNIIVKQQHFPQAKHAVIEAQGQIQKSKPRWLSHEVIAWAACAYTCEVEQLFPKKRGRPRKSTNIRAI